MTRALDPAFFKPEAQWIYDVIRNVVTVHRSDCREVTKRYEHSIPRLVREDKARRDLVSMGVTVKPCKCMQRGGLP